MKIRRRSLRCRNVLVVVRSDVNREDRPSSSVLLRQLLQLVDRFDDLIQSVFSLVVPRSKSSDSSSDACSCVDHSSACSSTDRGDSLRDCVLHDSSSFLLLLRSDLDDLRLSIPFVRSAMEDSCLAVDPRRGVRVGSLDHHLCIRCDSSSRSMSSQEVHSDNSESQCPTFRTQLDPAVRLLVDDSRLSVTHGDSGDLRRLRSTDRSTRLLFSTLANLQDSLQLVSDILRVELLGEVLRATDSLSELSRGLRSIVVVLLFARRHSCEMISIDTVMRSWIESQKEENVDQKEKPGKN